MLGASDMDDSVGLLAVGADHFHSRSEELPEVGEENLATLRAIQVRPFS